MDTFQLLDPVWCYLFKAKKFSGARAIDRLSPHEARFQNLYRVNTQNYEEPPELWVPILQIFLNVISIL